jgi:hypothetical protein
MIELMIDQNDGLDSEYNQVIRPPNLMYVYVLKPQVAHSSHEDRLDVNRRPPPRVPPIRQGINMDRQQDRRYFMGMYKMPCLIGGTRGGGRRLTSRRSSCDECATCGSSTSVCEYSSDSSDGE